MRTITSKEAKQTDTDDTESKALRLAFELQPVRKQYANYQPVNTTKMIDYTFVDTTFDKLNECVVNIDCKSNNQNNKNGKGIYI